MQPDKSVTLLLKQLSTLQGNWLIIADENWYHANWQTVSHSPALTIRVFSNRFDITKDIVSTGLNCIFNDFDFSELSPQSFDGILYRVSKERSTSCHIINQTFKLLKPKGSMLLGGEKSDGIKTYTKQASQLFDCCCHAEKHGTCYLASLQLNSTDWQPLDDKNYQQLRSIETVYGLNLVSKPGVFGWNKIDRGSAFLIEHLFKFINSYHSAPTSLLDLGCGYGYIACCASQFNFTQITATDNNAAALNATATNLAQLEVLEHSVVPSDAGEQVTGEFDTVLCNPPFHKGFAIDNHLSDKFLSNTKRLLKSSLGRGLFVVNGFIPLEHRAKQHFNHVEILANNRSFKLVAVRE